MSLTDSAGVVHRIAQSGGTYLILADSTSIVALGPAHWCLVIDGVEDSCMIRVIAQDGARVMVD